ncbi:hypothetical protein HME9304_02004 [Flagellimonas maritima]|uniref:Uncharacterized protein n=1 Tax=Flagellimonas maritima TaxID=1383885 RepID=A0A2Z4LUM9_9FLAO|nr:hypothetical protein [Allomuricauda aurantiaca]AWX44997.1 hypothetical protein HME9304_02004 [Allomuricauda aurantiaca]
MSGHIIDMVNRIKQNKIPKRKKFQGDNRKPIYVDATVTTEYNFPKFTKSELEKFSAKFGKEKKRDWEKTILYFSLCLLVLVIFATLFFKLYKLPH